MTSGALNAADAISAADLKAIGERRSSADTALNAGVDRLAQGPDFPNRARLLDEVKAAQSKLTEARVKVDGNLAKPRSERDASVTAAWVPTITALIEKSRTLQLAGSATNSNALRQLATLADLKDASWIVAEYAGRERATIAGRLAQGQMLSGEDRNRLAQFRGRLELAWDRIRFARAQGILPAEVVATIDAADTEFFTSFATVRQQIYAAQDAARFGVVDDVVECLDAG